MFKGIVKDQAFSFFPSSFRFRSHADIATLLAALWYLGPISGSCACKSRQYKQSEDVIMIDAETGHVLRYRLLANAWYDICNLLYIYNWNLYSSFIYVSMVYANVYTYIFTYYTYWLYLHRYYFICRAIEIQRGLKFEEPLADHTLFVATVNWCKLLVQQICSQSCDMFLTFRITLWDWRERERERGLKKNLNCHTRIRHKILRLGHFDLQASSAWNTMLFHQNISSWPSCSNGQMTSQSCIAWPTMRSQARARREHTKNHIATTTKSQSGCICAERLQNTRRFRE